LLLELAGIVTRTIAKEHCAMSSRTGELCHETRWIMLGSGAVTREFFLPAFAHLNTPHKLLVLDLTVPNALREAYPQVEFMEGDFRRSLDSLDQQKVTAAIVALPNKLHEEAVVRLLAVGAHVLCEKPLALQEAACLRIRDAALAARRLVAINMVRRLFPSLRTATEMVSSGEIGDLRAIDVEHGGPFHWPAQSLALFFPENGGVFADMGIHYLDLAESLAGPLELRSYHDDSQGGVEAEATAELESVAGINVRIRLSRLRTLGNTITLVGTDGRIVLNVESLSTFNLYCLANGDGVEVRPLHPFGSCSWPVSLQTCFARQIQGFEHRISAGDISTEDLDSAARSAHIIEQAYHLRLGKRRSYQPAAVPLDPAPSLVTGATGFIGTHLVERLIKCGSDVTCLVRRPQTCASIARFPTNLVAADLLDFEAVRKAVEGKRYIFHLAYGRDGPDARAITLRGTENVVNAAIAARCEAVVILSTINVLGWPEGEVDESAPYRPAGGAYGQTKARMERWCLRRAQDADAGNTRIVVLLPSCVYGPNGPTFTELPAKLAREDNFAWIAEGQGIANYVFIDNLIDAIFLAASSPRAHGQRFIINDGWTSWRDFLNPIVSPWNSKIHNYAPGELVQKNARSRRGALKRAFRAAISNADVRRELKQTMLGLLGRRLIAGTRLAPRPVTEVKVSPTTSNAPPEWVEDLFGAYKTRFSCAKARSVLGWMPRVPLQEGQHLSVEYLREIGLHPRCSELDSMLRSTEKPLLNSLIAADQLHVQLCRS
jgi:nucleoside-diphosphate-sugar epimerase/predicted dehydrogenase